MYLYFLRAPYSSSAQATLTNPDSSIHIFQVSSERVNQTVIQHPEQTRGRTFEWLKRGLKRFDMQGPHELTGV